MRQTARVHCGDALDLLQGLEDDSVDAVVTDPPSGISFMGKAWDSDKGGRDAWIAWLADIMREALRVTKPGGHALVWALPRTQHWTATAVENAGWEVRDVLMHVFGSGFPKSTSVSLRIDAEAGATREVIGTRKLTGTARKGVDGSSPSPARPAAAANVERAATVYSETTPATDEAKQWAGWGTALKPSHEAWILARKPLAGTVAANVLAHGTGALNIDGCRVGTDGGTRKGTHPKGPSVSAYGDGLNGACEIQLINAGRWPPHLLLTHAAACGETCADGCPVAEMDAQSGRLVSGSRKAGEHAPVGYMGSKPGAMPEINGDAGGASRFFPVFRYVAKPSTAEKSAGLDGRNTHATVKPLQLMRWLCRLITPPGGLVLDPFAGSGTTGAAAMAEGFSFIGAEMRPEQAAAARQRIQHALAGLEVEQSGDETPEPAAGPGQLGLW